MKIKLREVTIREIYEGYIDSKENGVVGYNGNLNIRPKYQREFVYKDSQRNAVIETVMKNFPLNVMYWSKNNEEDYELLDGQQRTISICKYLNGEYSIESNDGNPMYFHNLTKAEQDQIYDYKLMIYVCEGNEKEKLEWFKTINIAGEKLTNQELRNAIYTGKWLTEAKEEFSKTDGYAYREARQYLKGTLNRQEYLEIALRWIADEKKQKIEEYMALHQHDEDANELYDHFYRVITWVKYIFPDYRKEMKGVEWGLLYNCYKDNKYNPKDFAKRVKTLMQDDDVTKKNGIYEYLLSKEEKHLNIRAFSNAMKREAYERQTGICPSCSKHFEIEEMEGDHITPWHLGGKTIGQNCQMLCKGCNRTKSGK